MPNEGDPLPEGRAIVKRQLVRFVIFNRRKKVEYVEEADCVMWKPHQLHAFLVDSLRGNKENVV